VPVLLLDGDHDRRRQGDGVVVLAVFGMWTDVERRTSAPDQPPGIERTLAVRRRRAGANA
jgi:hypothetical protein